MMREVLYASDFEGKDVLDLETGNLIGSISGVLIEENPLRVSAFAYRVENEAGQHMAFCSFSQVTDIDQQVVVISSAQSYLPSDAKSLLGLPCLDANGKLFGRVQDCAWTQSNGMLTEIVLGANDEWFGVAIPDIEKIGSGALIFSAPENGLHKNAYQRSDVEDKSGENAEEMMRSLIRRVGTTLSGAGQKVGERVKQIDTEELNRDINRFTEKVGKEIRNVIDTISEQSKASKYATMESEVISVLRDLEGFTVTSPIYDNHGEIIIMPGHTIDANTVRRAIESDKLAELYRVAVSIKHGESNE
ncbi:MAG: hypothetical protein UC390_10435 [Peptococcaceae bacterium]|nr:hypothetical protein [Peptococcaceae bacterium]